MTPRRCTVLVTQLKPGSRLHRARGGPAAWSDETAALHHEGQRIVTATLYAGGAKEHQIPKPPEPPKEGWQAEARARDARTRRKLENGLRRERERQAQLRDT